jgi:hypothetical protein
MSDFRHGDRVVVLRLDSDDIECRGCYAGKDGPMMFVLPDDDDLPDPIAVAEDRVRPEKARGRLTGLVSRRFTGSAPAAAGRCRAPS